VRYRDVRFESFVVMEVSCSIFDVCRCYVEVFGEGGVGFMLAGLLGIGKMYFVVVITCGLVGFQYVGYIDLLLYVGLGGFDYVVVYWWM